MKKYPMPPKKRGRGRPPTDTLGIQVRIPREMVDALDERIAAQPKALSRPEAIRQSVARDLQMPAASNATAPGLSDAAWRLLRKHAWGKDGEVVSFAGDRSGWDWLWAEIWKRNQRKP